MSRIEILKEITLQLVYIAYKRIYFDYWKSKVSL